MRAYAVLEDTVRALIESEQLDVDLDDATWLCWSTMQGLVTLGPKLDVIADEQGSPGPVERRARPNFHRANRRRPPHPLTLTRQAVAPCPSECDRFLAGGDSAGSFRVIELTGTSDRIA